MAKETFLNPPNELKPKVVEIEIHGEKFEIVEEEAEFLTNLTEKRVNFSFENKDNHIIDLRVIDAPYGLPSGLIKLKHLIRLDCSNADLSQLPELPESLQYLFCNDNKQLAELPKLPANLMKLFCFNTQIIELPELPARLMILNCINSKITKLPSELPEALKEIVIDRDILEEKSQKLFNKLFIENGKDTFIRFEQSIEQLLEQIDGLVKGKDLKKATELVGTAIKQLRALLEAGEYSEVLRLGPRIKEAKKVIIKEGLTSKIVNNKTNNKG